MRYSTAVAWLRGRYLNVGALRLARLRVRARW
jgi:hypothetical protein